MGGTYGDPIVEVPPEVELATPIPETAEVERERGLPKPNEGAFAMLPGSCVGGLVSEIGAAGFTRLSSMSRSTIRAEAGAEGKKAVGLLERRR